MSSRTHVRMGVIHATRVQIPRRDVIHASFLVPGPHWQQVARVLESAEPELVAEWKHEQEARGAAEAAAEAERRSVTARRRIDQLPSDLAPELIAACVDASRRIRLGRQVADERPVVLEYLISQGSPADPTAQAKMTADEHGLRARTSRSLRLGLGAAGWLYEIPVGECRTGAGPRCAAPAVRWLRGDRDRDRAVSDCDRLERFVGLELL